MGSPANNYSLSSSFQQCSHGDAAARGFPAPRAGHMLAVAVAGLGAISTPPKISQCPNSSPGPTAAKHCAGPWHVTNKGPGDLGKGPPKGCGFACFTLLLGFPGYPSYRATHSSRLFVEKGCGWLCCAALSHLCGLAHAKLLVSTNGWLVHVWPGCFEIPSFPPPSRLLVPVVHTLLGSSLSAPTG